MTGRSPWTRFSKTSPNIRPALFARSVACIQVLSSDMDAILYTVLTGQQCSHFPARSRRAYMGNFTAAK
jgi:hypothetical protein